MGDGVVVVGGGFAGFWAALAARRVGGGELEITMVAPSPVLVVRPRLYEARPESLSVDLVGLLDSVGVSFVADEATGVDVDARRLLLRSSTDIEFERLVVATGSVMRRPPVPGAEEAYSIDTQSEAVVFDRHLAQLAGGSRQLSLAVVGAGFTGIELALELRDRITTHGGDGAVDRLRIILIDQAGKVGQELGPGPRPVIEAALKAAGVELLLGSPVSTLGRDHLRLGDGTSLNVDAVVLTTGLVASPFTASIPGERDEVGRILVDSSLRATRAPRVFVTGDAASADTGDGHRALQSCQHALQLGRYAGENATRDLLGLPTLPYQQLRYVTCLDLGRSGAVLTQGWDREVVLTGDEAKARKTMINTEVIYPPADATAEELLRQSQLDPGSRQ